MNGARFKWIPKLDAQMWDYCCARPLPVCFPKLDTVRVISRKWSDFNGEDASVSCGDVTQLSTPSFMTQQSKTGFTSEELDSAGSSYSVSDQADSDSSQSVSECDNKAHLKLLHLGRYSVSEDDEYIEKVVYEPVSGAIMPLDKDIICKSMLIAAPIVDYLQHLCDMLEEDVRVPLFFTFTDYIVNVKELRQSLPDPPTGEVMPFDSNLMDWLSQCNESFISLHDCNDYIPARAIRLLKSAAEDFTVKVFAKANEMETSDALQADTFVNAANQLSKEYSPIRVIPFEKVTDPESRLHRQLLEYRVDENGKWVRQTRSFESGIVDL